MGRFKLIEKGKQWHFNLLAGNNEPILQSEMYESRAAALKGIQSVMTNSLREGAFRVKTAKNGQHYFVLKSANGQVVGQSEMYVSESNCNKGIESVINNARDSEVYE